LGDAIILAEWTFQVAPDVSNGICPASGKEMVQRLFLYWIDGQGACHTVIRQYKRAPAIPADAARSAPAILDNTMMMAQQAPDSVAFDGLIIICFMKAIAGHSYALCRPTILSFTSGDSHIGWIGTSTSNGS